MYLYGETGRNHISASPHGACNAIFKNVFASAGDKEALGSCSSARKKTECYGCLKNKLLLNSSFVVLLLRRKVAD